MRYIFDVFKGGIVFAHVCLFVWLVGWLVMFNCKGEDVFFLCVFFIVAVDVVSNISGVLCHYHTKCCNMLVSFGICNKFLYFP